ncbi:MAG: peptidoglycan DD-metalloendopeptidase family protein [Bdellovibrionales bacterium]|nr:peptidoglycan DD-metalloendopeptidase family protein [Bdellovibrionales bacterium]
MSRIPPLIFLLAVSWTVPVLAQPAPLEVDASREAAKQLEDVRRKIQHEQERLDDLRAREREIRASLEKIKRERDAAVQQRQELATSIAGLEQREKELEEGVAAAQEKIAKLQEGLGRRIVAIYKTHRRTSALDYLLESTSTTDLLKRARYLEAVARFDREYLTKLTEAVKAWSEDRDRLVQVKAEQEQRIESLRNLEKTLEAQRVRHAELLREERAKADEREKALEKLKASAARLEEVVAAVTGSESVPSEVKIVAAIARGGPKALDPKTGEPEVVVPFTGRGLKHVKGTLAFPVDGKVIQRFGKQQHDEFADILFVKGLEVIAPVATKVRAVAGGKVIFDRALPGYGNVLILDHGERYYTLYGRIAKSLVAMGDTVEAQQSIAEVGEPDHKGRNFYFELRIKGKATDPSSYFKQLPVTIQG